MAAVLLFWDMKRFYNMYTCAASSHCVPIFSSQLQTALLEKAIV